MLTIIAILLLISPAPCLGGNSIDSVGKGRSRIGIDLASCISSGTVRIEIGHSFNRNWSIDGDAGVKLLSMKERDRETLDHWKNIGRDVINDSSTVFRERFQEISIQTRYWPGKAYNGVFLSLGCRIGDRLIPDCCIGLGYVLQIRKKLHASLAFQRGIIDMIQNRQPVADGLRIGIGYIF